MAKAAEILEQIKKGGCDGLFAALYAADEATLARQRKRYTETIVAFESHYGAGREISVYATPGRTEIGGNHTDHQNGTVLAAAVNLDIIAVVAKNDDGVLRVRSLGFHGEDVVRLDDLEADKAKYGKSEALVRGVAAGLKERGGTIGGFDAYTTSDVLKGSGLSSSAAFEVCLASILNGEYNDGRFSPVELAIVSQYAENVHFGKPSGLMDQTACAVGGVVSIDFKDPASPVVNKVSFDLDAVGYSLVITDTKGDHAGLTEEYAAIRVDMERVANYFGKEVLREVDEDTFLGQIATIRAAGEITDRALLRAIHFFEDTKRAAQMADSLRAGDFDAFLKLVLAAGHSAFEFNQNAYVPGHAGRQEIALGLALSQLVLAAQGAWRLHGGGFAGTIQAFVPAGLLDAYCARLESVFGAGACHVLTIREAGCMRVDFTA